MENNNKKKDLYIFKDMIKDIQSLILKSNKEEDRPIGNKGMIIYNSKNLSYSSSDIKKEYFEERIFEQLKNRINQHYENKIQDRFDIKYFDWNSFNFGAEEEQLHWEKDINPKELLSIRFYDKLNKQSLILFFIYDENFDEMLKHCWIVSYIQLGNINYFKLAKDTITGENKIIIDNEDTVWNAYIKTAIPDWHMNIDFYDCFTESFNTCKYMGNEYFKELNLLYFFNIDKKLYYAFKENLDKETNEDIDYLLLRDSFFNILEHERFMKILCSSSFRKSVDALYKKLNITKVKNEPIKQSSVADIYLLLIDKEWIEDGCAQAIQYLICGEEKVDERLVGWDVRMNKSIYYIDFESDLLTSPDWGYSLVFITDIYKNVEIYCENNFSSIRGENFITLDSLGMGGKQKLVFLDKIKLNKEVLNSTVDKLSDESLTPIIQKYAKYSQPILSHIMRQLTTEQIDKDIDYFTFASDEQEKYILNSLIDIRRFYKHYYKNNDFKWLYRYHNKSLMLNVNLNENKQIVQEILFLAKSEIFEKYYCDCFIKGMSSLRR